MARKLIINAFWICWLKKLDQMWPYRPKGSHHANSAWVQGRPLVEPPPPTPHIFYQSQVQGYNNSINRYCHYAAISWTWNGIQHFPKIAEMLQSFSGPRNCQKAAISGHRNCRNPAIAGPRIRLSFSPAQLGLSLSWAWQKWAIFTSSLPIHILEIIVGEQSRIIRTIVSPSSLIKCQNSRFFISLIFNSLQKLSY